MNKTSVKRLLYVIAIGIGAVVPFVALWLKIVLLAAFVLLNVSYIHMTNERRADFSVFLLAGIAVSYLLTWIVL